MLSSQITLTLKVNTVVFGCFSPKSFSVEDFLFNEGYVSDPDWLEDEAVFTKPSHTIKVCLGEFHNKVQRGTFSIEVNSVIVTHLAFIPKNESITRVIIDMALAAHAR